MGHHPHLAWPRAMGHSARDGVALLPILCLCRPGVTILSLLPGNPGDLRIQAIHLHPKSVTLLAVFAYACEAWIGIKPSVAYFCHLFSLWSSGLN
jgi:hypothetical protein